MRMNPLPLVLAVTLCGCLRSPGPPPVPVENDTSILFPDFPEQDVVDVGTPGQMYQLDGEVLRAIMIAANDFLSPGSKDTSCRNRQEAQRYRVIRQGHIVFVHIDEDDAYCGRSYPALDSGVKYAISQDGRILRRVRDGEPENAGDVEPTDGGPQKTRAEPGVAPALDGLWNDPSRPWPPGFRGGAGRRFDALMPAGAATLVRHGHFPPALRNNTAIMIRNLLENHEALQRSLPPELEERIEEFRGCGSHPEPHGEVPTCAAASDERSGCRRCVMEDGSGGAHGALPPLPAEAEAPSSPRAAGSGPVKAPCEGPLSATLLANLSDCPTGSRKLRPAPPARVASGARGSLAWVHGDAVGLAGCHVPQAALPGSPNSLTGSGAPCAPAVRAQS